MLGKEVRWEAQNVYNPAAVVRDGTVTPNPSPSYRLQPGDTVFVLGTREQLDELEKMI